MSGSRRWFLKTALAGGAAWAAGCGRRAPSSVESPVRSPGELLNHALAAAGRFLTGRQSADGGWRSDHYGPFKDPTALTPLVLRTLLALPDDNGSLTAPCRKGADFLASLVRSDGSIDAGPQGVGYPVYASAGAVEALSRMKDHRYDEARKGWLTYLTERQLTEDLGWQPDDKAYGGWGYSPRLPRKPSPGEPLPPLTESNLSATVYALEALKAGGEYPAEHPTVQKALSFIERCQNWNDDPEQRDATFDDGGFFFIYDDPVRNKAGVAGKDRAGRERFASYGSMTADGWRALLQCGRSVDNPRVRAACAWMEEHFRADAHPGKYASDRESNRNAVYYYYCSSIAQTLALAGVLEPVRKDRLIRHGEALAAELIKRQREDGSWANPLVPQREDDPLVATSLAATALVWCR